MEAAAYFQPVPTDFICEAHGAPASGFHARADGNTAFFCADCAPKDQAEHFFCHPIAKLPLFKSLNCDPAEMRRRKERYVHATEFLNAMYIRHTDVHDRGKVLIERLYTLYMAVANLHHQTFESVLEDVKQEVETVYERPTYHLTKLSEALLLHSPADCRVWADRFFQVPHSAELESLQRKCEEPMWKSRQVVKKELAQAMLDQLKSAGRVRSVALESELRLPAQDEYVGDYNPSDQRHGSGKCIYRSGDVYEGEWKYDLKHGMGTQAFKDGRTYSGLWAKGEMHGLGKMKWRSGVSYEGKFYRGRAKSPYALWKYSFRGASLALISILALTSAFLFSNVYHLFYSNVPFHGLEFQRYSDGYYHGQFLEGMRHGVGTFLWPSGDAYIGMWKQDRMHGRGVLFERDRNVYSGEFQNGHFQRGQSLLHEEGDLYVGESLLGEKYGKGLYVSANGTIYSGTWARHLETGIGASIDSDFLYFGNFTGNGTTLVALDSGVYIGHTYAGRRHGKGILLRDGTFHRGTWHEGQQSGWGYYYAAGTYLIGNFTNGTFDVGYGSVQYANGDEYFGEFRGGLQHGSGVYLHSNGSVHTGAWVEGEVAGAGVRFDGSGYLRGDFQGPVLRSGSGLVFQSNRDIYFGGIANGTYAGNGTHVGNESTYSGEWRQGKPNGTGFRCYINGDYIAGRFLSGQLVEGSGFVSYAESKYFGKLKGHLHHGLGMWLLGNHTVYSGLWDMGRTRGPGLMAKAEEYFYRGNFVGNSLNRGVGFVKRAEGAYFGEILEHEMSGAGMYMWANHSAYVGTWQSDKRHGVGLLLSAAGYKSGLFYNDEFVRGKILEVIASNVYIGEFENGFSGSGLYLWASGGVYLGDWRNNTMSGRGLYAKNITFMRGLYESGVLVSGWMLRTLGSGDYYVGQAESGEPHGLGTSFQDTGSVYAGQWHRGRRLGQGFLAKPNLDFQVGHFNDSLQEDGRSLITYDNGDKYYGNIVNNKRSGCGAYLWVNGTVYSGNWHQDVQAGAGFVVHFDEGQCVGELQQHTIAEHAVGLAVALLLVLL